MSTAPDYGHIESCLQVGDDEITEALASARSLNDPSPRKKVMALVERMAAVAKPSRGAPKILIVLAHMATRDWLDGELRVRIIGDPEVSVLELLVDDGLSAQRILGPVRIDVPFSEFARALALRPDFVLPLHVKGKIEDRRVELETTARSRRTSVPPSFSAVSDSLLPFLSGGRRELPKIMSRPPPSSGQIEELEEFELLDEEEAETRPFEAELVRDEQPTTPQRFKPISLPPHMREALAGLKKKQ